MTSFAGGFNSHALSCSYLSLLAANASHEANRKGMLASYQRRQDEWVFQSKMALEDMKQLKLQIVAAQIRLEIAQKELENHLKQIDNAQAVDVFMRDKYTNQELYSWMTGQIANVYFSSYQLAYDIAKRAEKAFRNELGVDNSVSFIQFGYWDSLKKGLLAGETLSLDLKRMDVAYLERNRREYEISKQISLLQLDSLALVRLREVGTCEVSIPETLFDIDFPGHYFRRIKSVSISIPCVAGPYTSVNCTLRLLKHSYRRNAQVGPDGYPRKANAQRMPADDERFVDSLGGIQSIATSHGQRDSGVFELSFRDERYLPFEGAGAISTWRIELPHEFRQFDYGTIADVILQINYTAREGGELLAAKATDYVKGLVRSEEETTGRVRLYSVRHEFPAEWARFQSQIPGANQGYALSLNLRPEHYPFWSQVYINNTHSRVTRLDVLVQCTGDSLPDKLGVFGSVDCSHQIGNLYQDTSLGNLLVGKLDEIPLPQKPVQALNLYFDTSALSDVWLAVTWSN